MIALLSEKITAGEAIASRKFVLGNQMKLILYNMGNQTMLKFIVYF